ncbi:hypothetical protein [Lacimicrobium alkaliphilum]|uniref:Uncharacterized protein n=1 Tax=Lacimicrobium alkaliphilum TaxID=1526571 RepID=A0A0U2JJG4_9ALTE|nr:hypothetical protein [Lacimicrobium alkaliphilum]ALS99526.1 hypothetical protein AT746_15515 [Lacimicrobium alkaliphilum]
MIAHRHFASLRLRQFLAPESVEEFDSWFFMGREWLGEAFGATEFLRSKSVPDDTRLISLDLLNLPPQKATMILSSLDMPVRPGMSEAELLTLFGAPAKVHNFLPDRKALDFQVFQPDPYQLTLTLFKEQGLGKVLVLSEV